MLAAFGRRRRTVTASGGTTEPPGGSVPGGGGNIQAPGECGLGTGEPATGEPIKIGAMATNSPVADFTWITSLTGAYFECVNDNGGIHGRPIEYIAEEEQVDPQQIASLAVKLIEQDQVLGIVGSTSLIECSVNRDYYAEQEYYLIIAGVSQDCFTSPNYSAVNMGPYYSSLGGAQAAVRAGAEGTIVVASPNQPGFDLINSGVVEFAEQNGLEGVSILERPAVRRPGRIRPAPRPGGRRRWCRGARLHRPQRRPAAPGDRATGPHRLGRSGPARRRPTTRRSPRRSGRPGTTSS